jgi:hypothetical protein
LQISLFLALAIDLPATGSGTKGKKGAAVRKAGGRKKKRVTRLDADAGLDVHVRLIKRDLKKLRYEQRIGMGPPAYIVDALERISSEVLKLAKNAALRNKKMELKASKEPKSPKKSAKPPKKKDVFGSRIRGNGTGRFRP